MPQTPSFFIQRGVSLYNRLVGQRLSLRSGAASATQPVGRTYPMVDEDRDTGDWRINVRERLAALHDSLTSSELSSEIPLYVIETLVANIERFMRSPFDADSARDLFTGAFRAISDPATADDDDPIVKQLLEIHDLLPPEQ